MPHRRYAQCFGLADARVVEVSEWDLESQRERLWRLGIGQQLGRCLDVDPLAEDQIRVRASQVLTLGQTFIAFRDWLALWRLDGFTMEEIDF